MEAHDLPLVAVLGHEPTDSRIAPGPPTGSPSGWLDQTGPVDGVRVGWGKAIRDRLSEGAAGPLPVDGVAKRLACELRAG